jgi:hypothetical protein
MQFFEKCRVDGVSVFIVSHKTSKSNRGEYDLHLAAREWLVAHGFLDSSKTNLSHDRIFFEETREEKIKRAAALGCTHFIDDLPEFLLDPSFPEGIKKILFSPTRHHHHITGMYMISSWGEVLLDDCCHERS